MQKSDVRAAEPNEIPKPGSAYLIRCLLTDPYAAYLVLKDWFGQATENPDEPKSQWEFNLVTPSLYLSAFDWKVENWVIHVYRRDGKRDEESKKQARSEIKQFLSLVREQKTKHKGRVKEAASAAQGFVIQNPFLLYFNGAKSLLDEAKTQNRSPETWGRVGDLCRAAFFMFMASAEGLLNLVYELYLNPALRDDRIYDRLQREQIDIKLRLAPAYCTCFNDDVIDATTEEFRQFQFLIGLRNDFIHANLTKPMKRLVVEEDGFIFLVEQGESVKYEMTRNATDLQVPHIDFVQEIIQGLVQLVLGAMKPRYRREFSEALDSDFIRIDVEDGEFVVVQ
jgi:hypothetical protein